MNKRKELWFRKYLTRRTSVKGFWEIQLCKDCQPYGYCRSGGGLFSYSDYDQEQQKRNFDISNFIAKIPLRGDSRSGKNERQAHDAFHQEDYETALYLYKIDGRNLLAEAICYFQLQQYENAASALFKILDQISYNWHYKMEIDEFLDACEARMLTYTELSHPMGDMADQGEKLPAEFKSCLTEER